MFRMHIQLDEGDLCITVGFFSEEGNPLGRDFADPDYVSKDELESYFADAEPGVLELAREVMSNKKKFATLELIPRLPQYTHIVCAKCGNDDEEWGCGFVLKSDLPEDFDPDKHRCSEFGEDHLNND